MAAARIKKRIITKTSTVDQSAIPLPPREMQRRSFSKAMRFAGSHSNEEPNLGITESVDDLIRPEVILKGLFGFSDLSSFGTESSGSFSMDVQSSDLRARQVVQPVFAFKKLTHLYLTSTTLRECVKAYVSNIESYGHRLEYIGPEGKRESRAAVAEKERVDGLLASLVQSGETLKLARENSRIDKEVIGARAFEVMEDAMGRVVGIKRLPTNTLLLTRLDKDPTPALIWNPVTKTYVMQKRRFRRYMQRDDIGRVTYFKELGDPRPINARTGDVDFELDIEDEATAVWYDGYYTPGSPYGTPQWSACIPAMMGAREAEHVNLSFFRDNAIPAMAILVSGGALTEESFNKIESYFTNVKGKDAQNRIVVLEASSDVTEVAGIDGSIAAPKIDIKPMLSERQNEGLFKDYIGTGGEKIRQAMRLPPIYIGHASEYNRASAFASMQTAEQQVFIPERMAWESFMNDVVLVGYQLKYWRVAAVQPAYNDAQETAQILTVLGREGALTPNICIQLANRYLNTSIESVQDEWGDMPFAVTLAALEKGAKIAGFDYAMEALATASAEAAEQAARVAEANKPEDGEGSGDKNTDDSSIAKGVVVLLDEVAEQHRRLSQNLVHAA